MKYAVSRTGGILALAALLQACGGGGGGGGGGNGPAGLPPPPNRPPVSVTPIPDQRLVTAHPFSFDVSQGGSFFADPDNDRLTYHILFTNPAPPGLSISGTVIAGTPTTPGSFSASIRVTDGRGGEILSGVLIDVFPNSPPVVAIENPDQLLAASDFVDLEVTHGGTAFTDADGDSITYEVGFAASGHGLSITGTRITGTMNSSGLARVRVIARDGFGGVTEDAFSLVLPAPEPGVPTLPSLSYVYDDDELNLPCRYEVSREIRIPFPDTTPADNPTTNAGATLGRVLFYDKRVSSTNTVSCASCHRQDRGFAVAQRFSIGAQGTPQTRNAMSLANVRYSQRNDFFWDERVNSLENLIPIPIENPEELAHSMGQLEAKLAATAFYPPLFEAAFGSPEITSDRISKATAQFLRAMISYRSKFDDAFLVPGSCAIADPSLTFNAQESRGLQVAAESSCFSCHDDLVLILSTGRNNGLDRVFTDPGAGRGRFGPPSLKNIRVTGPYMHDGRFATLRDVIDHYDVGVQDSPELDSTLRVDQTGQPRRLNLSAEDKDALEAYLDTLTDHAFLADPRFSDPFQ